MASQPTTVNPRPMAPQPSVYRLTVSPWHLPPLRRVTHQPTAVQILGSCSQALHRPRTRVTRTPQIPTDPILTQQILTQQILTQQILTQETPTLVAHTPRVLILRILTQPLGTLGGTTLHRLYRLKRSKP